MKTKKLRKKLEAWILDLIRHQRAENTIIQYRKSVELFLDFIEQEGAKKLNPDLVLKYLSYLEKMPARNGKPISVTTYNARIVALNRFLAYCGYKEDPLKGKKLNKKYRDDILTGNDVKRLLEWCDILTDPTEKNKTRKNKIKAKDCRRERLIIECLSLTAIRISELEAFTVDTLKNAKKADRSSIYFEVTNKGKTRDVYVPITLRNKLLDYAKERNITDVIFCKKTDPHALMDKALLSRNLKYIAGQARIPKRKVHCHNFRHYYSSNFLQTPGNDITMLQEILGHDSIDTTTIYLDRSRKDLAKAISKSRNLKC